MNPSLKPTPAILTGDEHIQLYDCYVFRDGFAHKAQVSIAAAVSYTDLPHLFNINVAVPGSKNMTFSIGIPFDQAMRLDSIRRCWDSTLQDYDAVRSEIAASIFEQQIEDLTKAPWTAEEIRAVEQMETWDEVRTLVKDDLLTIAAAAMEKQDV